MPRKTNKPIFVVGSPRSGTSILTWCLGQHPNIFPVPESNWMGEFAVNIASSYQMGAARDNRTILSGMDISRDEFFVNFGQAINDLILSHRRDLERKRDLEGTLNRKHSTSEPKARWIDGTPEYSLHIHGLRKLFPEAVFIHIVRDVDSVVRSMLNFHRVAGTQLVTNEEQAYKYWLRMVDACLKAEQAYGPRVIHRLQYATLIDNPQAAIRSLLDFVGEPYSAKCLEPLAQRINSSNVPVDFQSEDPATDPKIVEAARRLYTEIEQTPQPAEGSPAVADQLEAAFQEPYLRATRLQQELSEQIAKVEHYASEIEEYKLNLARQEQHYTAEIGEYELQLARQEHHYTAEIEQYKLQVARQQRDYTAQIEEHKKQLASQEQHYTAEVEEYKLQVARQERHYTAEIEEYKTQLASQERHYVAQIEEHKSQLVSQEQHYTAQIEEHKSQLGSQEQHYTAEIEQYKLQVARQERDYTAEIEEHKKQLDRQERHYVTQIEEHKSQLGSQQQHYTAEIEQYKIQVARQERHYTGEIEEYKTQLARQEHHYTAEIEQYKSQLARQERHYVTQIEEHKLQLARQEEHYTKRLRRQLQDTKKLAELLNQFANAAARLANSRRWKLANVGAVIKAKLSRGKVPTGYDPLDKIVAAYSRWRASHPEIGKLDEEINALQPQAIPETPAIEPEKNSQSPRHPGNGSSETALAAKTSAISPPVS
jgi:hypothetical protein